MSLVGIIFAIWTILFVVGAFFIKPRRSSREYDNTRAAVSQAILDADQYGHKRK